MMEGNDRESRRNRLRSFARSAVYDRDLKVEKLSAEDLRVLIHEFGVYQAELETRNEELREARYSLEETRERYRELYEFAPVGYFTLDGEGFIREANLAGCRLLGLERVRLLGRELASLLAGESVRELRRHLEEIEEGTVHHLEATLARKSPRHLRLEISTEGDEERARFKIAAVDITEAREYQGALEESERRFRSLAETAPLGIFEADRAGRFDYVNGRWETITGLPAGKSLAFGWTSAVHPEDRSRIIGEWAGRTGEGPWVQEFRLNRPDGPERWVRMLSASSGMTAGRPAGYVGTLEDISEIRNALEEKERALHAAEDASRAKSEFLANMSHEIRTPMTVFIAAVEHLLQIDEDPSRRRLLEMADQSATRLLSLIEDILDVSRIEARRVELKEELFAPRACLDKVAKMFALPARERGIRVETQAAPDVPAILTGDPGRLEQVLINLVGNAVKFTHEGEIRVSVRPKSGFLEFAVEDTGIGIPAEKQGMLFESFSQVDASLTRKYGGTGLGLAISKGLVELMGGEISVRSREGEGSVFTFVLPLKPGDGAGAAPAEVPAEGGSERFPTRVLVAEDEDMIRDLLVEMLAGRGFLVESAASGMEAVAKCEKGEYDLILMDVQMPEMDGLAASRAIREEEADTGVHTPIIGLTAHARRDTKEECLSAGMDDVLAKPVQREKLYSMIEAHRKKTE